jgi:type IV secretory pathway VirB10-like protein
MMFMKLISRLLLYTLFGMSVSACATAQARSAAAVPLEVPEPPPRAAIEPVSITEKTPPEKASAERPSPSPGVAATRPATPPAPAPATGAPQPAVPAAVGPPQPSVPAAVGPQPPAAAPTASSELRPSGSGERSISPREVREIIDRTSTKLGALNRSKLSAGKRADYDTARRFLSQAQEAATQNNLMLAHYSAEKAETLADGLK